MREGEEEGEGARAEQLLRRGIYLLLREEELEVWKVDDEDWP